MYSQLMAAGPGMQPQPQPAMRSFEPAATVANSFEEAGGPRKVARAEPHALGASQPQNRLDPRSVRSPSTIAAGRVGQGRRGLAPVPAAAAAAAAAAVRRSGGEV